MLLASSTLEKWKSKRLFIFVLFFRLFFFWGEKESFKREALENPKARWRGVVPAP